MLLKNELFRILGDRILEALMCCEEERGEGCLLG
jgi:hypothetical protein